MNNIYKTPDAELVQPATSGNQLALYKISGVGIATFFGSLIAGGYLAAYNLKALGRHHEARNVMITTVTASALLVIVSYTLPARFNLPGIAAGIVQTMIMVQFSKKWFAYDIASHMTNHGKMHSNWNAFGISILFLLLLLGIIFLIAYFLAI
ncbi:MAG: hypothetical protein HYZ31_07045 [Gammaproteobacteria bacterium]|nr:hypothetical protein [Gammaproteobacteria bacterium]